MSFYYGKLIQLAPGKIDDSHPGPLRGTANILAESYYYLVPLAIIDFGGNKGVSVTTSQVITEVGQSISQLNSSKVSMIDPSHVKQQA